MGGWVFPVVLVALLAVSIAKDIRTSRRGDFNLEGRLDRMFPWWNHPEIESPGQAAKTRALIYTVPCLLPGVVVDVLTRTDAPPITVFLIGLAVALGLLRREQLRGDRYPWNRRTRTRKGSADGVE